MYIKKKMEIDNNNQISTQQQIVQNYFNEEEVYNYEIDEKKYKYNSFISNDGPLGPIALFERDNKYYAIKMIQKPYDTTSKGKKVLKYLKILFFLNHKNIVNLKEIYVPDLLNYQNIYLIYEKVDTNLDNLINSNYDYFSNKEMIPWIIYQILKGLNYLHGSGIIHRNLKLSNILLDSECHVKLSGFGNAISKDNYENTFRGEVNDFVSEKGPLENLAPEILASKKKSNKDYDETSDLWSLGCIVASLYTKISPFFPPWKNSKIKWIRQLNGIFRKLGKPSKEILNNFASNERCKDILKFTNFQKMELKDLYPNVTDKNTIDLLEKLLCINPKERVSILEAKEHPYFNVIKKYIKNDDFSLSNNKKFVFDLQNDINEMEKNNTFYNTQIDFYKDNIKKMNGKIPRNGNSGNTNYSTTDETNDKTDN